MSKDKASKADLKNVEKKDRKNTDYKVREGMEDSAVSGDEMPPDDNTYPVKKESDKQYNHQPELTEPYSDQSKEKDK